MREQAEVRASAGMARSRTPITAAASIFAALLLAAPGCTERPSLLPNPDPALRKTSTEFAADAAKRHPYKADAPRGGEAAGRAAVDYGVDKLELANFSDEDWINVEVWVNQKYVVFVPKLEKGAVGTKKLDFEMLFDDAGLHFPTNNMSKANQVQKVELLRDGKLYDLRAALAD